MLDDSNFKSINIHSTFRANIMLHTVIMIAACYFFKFTPYDAGLCCLLNAMFLYFVNLYKRKSLKNKDSVNASDISISIIGNAIAMGSWLVLSLLFIFMGFFNIPALIKVHM